mgnify:CR=1 FL=1
MKQEDLFINQSLSLMLLIEDLDGRQMYVVNQMILIPLSMQTAKEEMET